ncbi:MAG TPA: SDR family oxidoreductase [Candidatus Obscuribacterales bacterium]
MTHPRSILITGASSGIGQATARHFLAQGWQVAATMRQPEKDQALGEQANLLKLRLDVEEPATVQAALQTCVATFGRLDVLLNNAGYGSAGPLEAASDEQIRRQFEVNLFGLIDVIRAALPILREQRSGLIMNVSSIGGLVAFPLFSLYHASKWAVEGLTESLQFELNPLGIKLKLIEPGGVHTDFAGRSLDMFDASAYPDYQPTLAKLLAHFAPDGERASRRSTAAAIAAGIYEAATDGKDQLRYVLGADAQQTWTQRQAVPYETFREGVRQLMLG